MIPRESVLVMLVRLVDRPSCCPRRPLGTHAAGASSTWSAQQHRSAT